MLKKKSKYTQQQINIIRKNYAIEYKKDKNIFVDNKVYYNSIIKHPTVEISSNNKKWVNLGLTTHPNNLNNYTDMIVNPNPNVNSGDKSYFKKTPREDVIYSRKRLYKNYKISIYDYKKMLEHLNK